MVCQVNFLKLIKSVKVVSSLQYKWTSKFYVRDFNEDKLTLKNYIVFLLFIAEKFKQNKVLKYFVFVFFFTLTPLRF